MKSTSLPTLADYRLPPSPSARQGGSRPPAEPGREHPLVSIVTVVYQGERYLQETIESVVSQDYPALEYIVIDGGSTDGTLGILAANDDHISYWRSEPDHGIYDAMNKGIALARGHLIKLLNADDILCPDSVNNAVSAYQDGANEGVIKSDLELIDEDGRFVKLMDDRRAINPFGAMLHPSWYVSRTIYEQHGLYDRSYRICADYELFVRLHVRGVPFHHLPVPLARFRSGGASSSFVGVKESFRTNQIHLGRLRALAVLARHGYVKARAKLLRALFDEHTLARLQRRLTQTNRSRR